MIYIDPILTYIHKFPDYFIYIFLGISAFVENFVPPIPGDTITVFGAFLVGSGRLNFFGVYTSTTLGSLLGFICLFRVGEYLGQRFFLKKDHVFFSRNNIKRAEHWLRRYGYFIVLMNRFLPGIRSVISITSGILRLNSLKVLLFSLISCALWNILCISLGYILGNNWDMVRTRIAVIFARYNLALLILFLVFILFLIIRKKLGR